MQRKSEETPKVSVVKAKKAANESEERRVLKKLLDRSMATEDREMLHRILRGEEEL